MFLLLPPMCVDLYFFFVCVVFYGQEVDIGIFSIIGLPERAKPNQEMRSTIFLCQKKKEKMADESPRGFAYPIPSCHQCDLKSSFQIGDINTSLHFA